MSLRGVDEFAGEEEGLGEKVAVGIGDGFNGRGGRVVAEEFADGVFPAVPAGVTGDPADGRGGDSDGAMVCLLSGVGICCPRPPVTTTIPYIMGYRNRGIHPG